MTFPPIYILSLKDAQRSGPLVELLTAHGLPFEIIWGVDGRHGLPKMYEELIDRDGAELRMGRPMSDGEFACALSHRLIYERIASSEAPSAIVLEDDAAPMHPFFEIGPNLIEPPCGLLLFDHKNTYVKTRDRLLFKQSLCAYRIMLPPFLATGYMISKEVATYLAFNNGPVVQPSDWPDAILKFESYACNPRIVIQKNRTESTSTLEKGRRKQKYKKRKSYRRLLFRSYWRRWLIKRLSKKLA